MLSAECWMFKHSALRHSAFIIALQLEAEPQLLVPVHPSRDEHHPREPTMNRPIDPGRAARESSRRSRRYKNPYRALNDVRTLMLCW